MNFQVRHFVGATFAAAFVASISAQAATSMVGVQAAARSNAPIASVVASQNGQAAHVIQVKLDRADCAHTWP